MVRAPLNVWSARPEGTAELRWLTFHLDLLLPGSFHLIHLMFDDYVLYLLESLHCQERANELMRAMKGEGSTGKRRFTGARPPSHTDLCPYVCAVRFLSSTPQRI